MKHFHVVVEPFKLLNLLTLEGIQQVNEHGTVTFSGIIPPELEDEYISMALSGTWAKILEIDDKGTEKVYFQGIVTAIDILSEDELKTIFVTLKTGTYLMDTGVHTRSYQTPSMTYDTVLSSYTKDYPNSGLLMKKGLSLFEADVIYYLYRTKEIYRLGQQINFNDKPMYIYKIKTEYYQAELIHTYYIKSLNGFLEPKTFNANAIGVSFYSVITAVEKDIVQISINDDENKGGCGSRWFPYSTVYSTPDGTGWYCMPEIGDAVRIYIPMEDEAKAYVISSTHLTSSAGDERVNPDFKSIMNKQKKEVLFTPDSLIFTNNNGMSVEILDDEGIKIISDKSIVFESDEAIEMVSTQSTITVLSPEQVVFKQGDTTTQLQKNIAFNGAQVHLD